MNFSTRDIFAPTSGHCSLQAKKAAQCLTPHIHVFPSLFNMTHFSRMAPQVPASHITGSQNLLLGATAVQCKKSKTSLPKKALIKHSMHKFGGMLHCS